jgi:hypothetical protein
VERAKAGEKPPSKPTPPSFKNGMALREYQVTSFEWMVGNYRRRKNVILGDEMGLGKTAQCISVMEHVRTTLLRAPRPFLVIAPLTTLGHWKREMEKWTDMNVVVLDGNAEDRRVCEETEFYFSSKGKGKGPAKFDVLLISFETARRLTDLIASFEWAMCVVDEAHKLKDVNSQTTRCVMDIPYEWLLVAHRDAHPEQREGVVRDDARVGPGVVPELGGIPRRVLRRRERSGRNAGDAFKRRSEAPHVTAHEGGRGNDPREGRDRGVGRAHPRTKKLLPRHLREAGARVTGGRQRRSTSRNLETCAWS